MAIPTPNIKTLTAVTGLALTASFSNAAITNMTANSDWATGIWSNGVPGAADVVGIDAGVVGTANAAVDAWSGALTLNSGSQLRMNNKTLGYGAITSATNITLGSGSLILTNSDGTINIPSIVLAGDATWESVDDNSTINFGNISGAFKMTFIQRNNKSMRLTTSNSFSEFVSVAVDRTAVFADAAGSLGTGDVTINRRTDGRGTRLTIGANDAMADTATLNVFGNGWNGSSGQSLYALIMNADDTIQSLNYEGSAVAAGTYTGDDFAWIGGSGKLTVTGVPEPSSTALLCLGGLALILRRRR